jgi:hypothetical protein
MEKLKEIFNDRFFVLYVAFVVFCMALMWGINIWVGLTVWGAVWSVIMSLFMVWQVYKEYRRRPIGRRARKVVR